MKKKQTMDVLVIGFALFSMFFGAGNLIFPPKLGLQTGQDWAIGFTSFTIADAGLALVAILATIRGTGELDGITRRVGRLPSMLLGISVFLCVGPLMAIPRTAASTFELGVGPVFRTDARVLFAVAFFLLVFVLSVRPSKVIDIIGKFLTPALYVSLLVLIVQGLIHPVGQVADLGDTGAFATGIAAGYQTMDVFAAVIFTVLVTQTLRERQYEGKERMSIVIRSGLVAAIGLTVVYGGLAYLGATASSQYSATVGQSELLLGIVQQIMGRPGICLLGIVAALACLTTAIGLTSAAASYFSDLTKNKVSYKAFVILICVFSAVVSNFGIKTIVAFSSPILTVVYPAMLTLIALSFFDGKIKNDWVFQLSTGAALLVSLCTVLSEYIGGLSFIHRLPLSSLGLGWILPAIVCGAIGFFLPCKKRTENMEHAGQR